MNLLLVMLFVLIGVQLLQLLPKKVLPVLRDSQELFQEDGIEKFQNLFRRYLVLNPDAWKDVFDSVWETYPQDRVVFNMVPTENEALKSHLLQEIAKQADG